MKLRSVSLGLLGMGVVMGVSAGTPTLLELPAADGTRGTVTVDSFSWGVHNAGSSATGAARVASGGGAGKVNVQDISMTKRAAPAPTAAEEPAPAATDAATTEVTFQVDPAAGPAAAALVDGCVKGKHFAEVVIVVNGQRQVAKDATFTCAPPSDAAPSKKRDFTGHVTLMK